MSGRDIAVKQRRNRARSGIYAGNGSYMERMWKETPNYVLLSEKQKVAYSLSLKMGKS